MEAGRPPSPHFRIKQDLCRELVGKMDEKFKNQTAQVVCHVKYNLLLPDNGRCDFRYRMSVQTNVA